MQRAFCVAPTRVCRSRLGALRAVQPLLNRLYDAVGRDEPFVTSVIRARVPHCAWQERELEVHERVAAVASAKPRLLLPNSVYLQPAATAAEPSPAPVLTVGNVQAGEPWQHSLVYAQQRAMWDVEAGPLHMACAALAAAARLVHPSKPCIAVLSKPLDALALRTITDVRGVGEVLRSEFGVPTVLYVSMAELAQARLDACGDLVLNGHAISVVYSRYDFSHPWGAPVPVAPAPPEANVAAAGDTLAHASAAQPAASAVAAGSGLWEEWGAIERMERSNAIVSSSLGARLAHRRAVQHALVAAGGVERFLPCAAEAAAVRAVLPAQWALSGARGARRHEAAGAEAAAAEEAEAAEAEAAAARELIMRAAEGVIAKNIWRPRTGSNATQDRVASGGVPLTEPAALRALVADGEGEGGEGEGGGGGALERRRREWYLLYRRVIPETHHASVVHAGEVHEIEDAVSELAVYGAFLADEGGSVLINEAAGVGVRTRPADARHALARELGYGALSCVLAE